MGETSPFRDQYWIARGSRKFLTYIGPPLVSDINRQDLQKFLAAHGAIAAMWNYDDEYTDQGPWYRMVCDREDYCMEVISSKNTRDKIKKCIKHCEIRPVDAASVETKAYQVYSSACRRYRSAQILSETQFLEQWRQKGRHPRIVFGVFYEDDLIAYMTVMDFNGYAMGDVAAFDPDFKKYYPMYGLYYFVARYFVAEQRYAEFDRGSKALLHQTNIDDMLENMGFRRKYCRLGLYLPRYIKLVLGCVALGRRLLPAKAKEIVGALEEAQRIAAVTSPSREC